MKNLLRHITSSLLLTAAVSAMAVPAKPGLINFSQPDGSMIKVHLYGDEFHHFYTSEDDYLLVQKDNQFYYANVDANGQTVNSNIKATNPSERTSLAREYLATVDMTRVRRAMQKKADARESRMAQTVSIARPAFAVNDHSSMRGPGLFPESRFPAMGDQKALVFIVEYQDVKMNLDDAMSYFTRMLNEDGFSDYGGTGSAAEYFRLVSDNQFRPEFDVYGVVTLSKSQSYYGGNSWNGDDQNPGDMVLEACQQYDDVIDFTEYDRDNDGYVDNVYVIYAGRGEASGGSANTVWPHSWTMTAAIGYAPTFDGVKVDRYGCSNEWEGSRPDGVGTFIHEFSHVIGLPDLYATSYTSAFTPGSWSALDYGPYTNDGCTPPLYGAFERYALGWMEPMPIDSPINATLPSISSNKAGIVKVDDDEFFLFENRQQESWDTYIPGHGMLVWHVDYNSSVWSSNTVNISSSHQYVDIEEADGTQTDYTRDGDAFPGTSNKTSFTDTTRPSMKSWGGRSLNTPITDIAENDGIITFKAMGGRTEPFTGTTANEAPQSDDESFTASWEPVEGAQYALTVFYYPLPEAESTRAEGEPEPVYLLNQKLVGDVTSYQLTGLEPGTEYFYYVTVTNGWEYSEPSNTVSVSTGEPPLNKKRVVALDATGIGEDCFTATWEELPGVTGYNLTVAAKQLTGHYYENCDFTDGVDALPEGWAASSVSSYLNTAYSGEAVPAIRFSKSGDDITSPAVAEEIHEVSYWVRGNGTSEEDYIQLTAVTPDGDVVADKTPIVTAKGGNTVVVDLDAQGIQGATSVKLTFFRKSGKGSVAVDDIKIAYGLTFELVPVEAYTDIAVGNVTSYAVTGLQPETIYSYTVTATDGTITSRPSNAIELTTAKSSGILEVTASAGELKVSRTANTVEISGLGDAATVTLYDIAGRTVASAAAANGAATLSVPAPGLYILRTPAKTLKLKL